MPTGLYAIVVLLVVLLAIGGYAAAGQIHRRVKHGKERETPVIVEDDKLR